MSVAYSMSFNSAQYIKSDKPLIVGHDDISNHHQIHEVEYCTWLKAGNEGWLRLMKGHLMAEYNGQW